MDDAQQEFNRYLKDFNFNTLGKYISTMSEDELKLFVEDAKQLSNDSNLENSI